MSHCVPERCELCGGDSKVVNSRPKKNSRYRMRECLKCAYRWPTYESLVDPDELPAELWAEFSIK